MNRVILFAFLLCAVCYGQANGFTGSTVGRGNVQIQLSASNSDHTVAQPGVQLEVGLADNIDGIVFIQGQGFKQEEIRTQSYGAGFAMNLLDYKRISIGNEVLFEKQVNYGRVNGMLITNVTTIGYRFNRHWKPYAGIEFTGSFGKIDPMQYGTAGVEFDVNRYFAVAVEGNYGQLNGGSVMFEYTF